MGCGMSAEEREGKQRNEEIDNQLKKDRMMQRNEIKMLLLGEIPADTVAVFVRLYMLTPPLPRRWWIWEIDNFEADEIDSRGIL